MDNNFKMQDYIIQNSNILNYLLNFKTIFIDTE